MPVDPRDGDEPEYDWLYGSRRPGYDDNDRPRSSDDPDPTRVMRVQPRPGTEDTTMPIRQSGRRTDGPNAPIQPVTPTIPPSAPPRRTDDTGPRPPRPKRKRRIGRWIGLVVALWLVFLVAVPFWALSRITKIDAFPTGARPADQPGTTYLIVGSDSRQGLTAKQRKRLSTGNAAGQRTDTIMLLHVGSGPNLLISIPRDSLVPIPGHGTSKINAAYAWGGPKLLIKTIEQDTGVKIDNYVEIGFAGVAKMVNAVGGITICPNRAIKDKDSGLNVKKGCQTVYGVQALAWSRARHPFPNQDLTRVQHQREVVAKVGDKVKSPWTFINPFRYVRVAKAGSSTVTVNKGMGVFTLGRFAWAMSHPGKTCTMPISDLAVHWDRARALQLMNLIKTDRTDQVTAKLCTKTGLPQ